MSKKKMSGVVFDDDDSDEDLESFRYRMSQNSGQLVDQYFVYLVVYVVFLFDNRLRVILHTFCFIHLFACLFVI